MKRSASGVLRIRPSRIGPSVWVEAEAHVLVGLVDDQLHRRELRGRDRARGSAASAATVASSSRERHGLVDQPDVGRLAPGQRPAGQRVLLGLAPARAGRSTCRTGRRPTCASRACRSRASSLAITRSAQSAKSLPPPTHQPCTWAITGFGERQTLMNFCVGATSGAVAHAKSLPGSQRAVGGDPLVPVVEAAAEVVAGAERAPGAAQHDHLHRRRRATAAPTAASTSSGIGGTIVLSSLGPVQRDRRDGGLDRVEDRLEVIAAAGHAGTVTARRRRLPAVSGTCSGTRAPVAQHRGRAAARAQRDARRRLTSMRSPAAEARCRASTARSTIFISSMREARAEAAAAAAAERDPGVGAGRLVEEALGPERVRVRDRCPGRGGPGRRWRPGRRPAR